MKLANWTAVLTVATLALAPTANAAGARLADCITMAKQVSAALDSAQPGASLEAARSEAAAGRSYCASQMYAQGVARYSKALQLLGKG